MRPEVPWHDASGSTPWRHWVGPNLLNWERGENLGGRSGRPAPSVWRKARQGGRAAIALPLVAAPLLALVLGTQARHWVVEAFMTICVLGGIVAAPILSLAAWVGMFLPEHMPLHQWSTVLFAVSLVWLCAAFIGAHVHHDATSRAGE